MKQTNNAIKFLMAQYRAIFKNANLKMFLAAATAAAAMAAGSAQAAPSGATAPLDNAALKTEVGTASDKPIIVDGTGTANQSYKNVALTGAAAGTPDFEGKVFTIQITGGADHAIDGAAADTDKLTASSGSLVISGSAAAAATKLTIGGKSGAVVTLDSVDVSKGTLALTKGSLTATSITLGETSALTMADGTVSASTILLKSGSSAEVTKGTLGAKGNTITVEKDATITGKGANADEAKLAGTVNVSGGTITVGAEKLTIDGSLTVSSGKFSTTAAAGIAKVTGEAHFNSEKSYSNSGTIVLGGTSTFADGSVDTAATGGKLHLDGTATMSSATLKDLLGGAEIASDTNKSATLVLNDQTKIDLGTAKIVGAADGQVDAKFKKQGTGTLTIKGTEAEFAGANDLIGNEGVTLSFDTITLGKDADVTVQKGGLTVGKSLTIKDNKALILDSGNSLTLAGTSGTISAKSVTVGSSQSDATLSVSKGNWSVPDLTVTKGKVVVAKDSGLTVTGALTPAASTTLEITGGYLSTIGDGTIAFQGADENSVKLATGGTLKLDEADIIKDKKLDTAVYKKNAVSGDGSTIIVIDNKTALTNQEFKDFKDAVGTSFTGVYKMNVDVELPEGDLTLDNIVDGLATDKYNQSTLTVSDAETISKSYSVGNVHVKADKDLMFAVGGSLILNTADKDGNFVSKNSGTGTDVSSVVAGVQFADKGNTLTLVGTGNIGAISTASDTSKGKLVIGLADETPVAGHVTVVSGGIGDTTNKLSDIALNDGSSLTVKSGHVFADNMALGAGTSLDVNGDVSVDTAAIAGADINVNNFTIKQTSSALPKDATFSIDAGSMHVKEMLALGTKNLVTIGTPKTGEGESLKLGSSAQVFAGKLEMKAETTVFVDPDFSLPSSLLVAKTLTDGTTDGTLAGNLAIGANSAVGLGFTETEFNDVMSKHLVDGKFVAENGYANAVVIGTPITIGNNSYINVDQSLKTASGTPNSVHLGDGAALVVTKTALESTNGAIKFTGTGTVTADKGSTVVLEGGVTLADQNLTLFSGTTMTITSNATIAAAGGLIDGTLDNATGKLTLTANDKKLDAIRSVVSSPIVDLLVDYRDGDFQGSTDAGVGFIEKMLNQHDFVAIDAAAHAATYAGAQQAAVAAVGTMAEAVGGRVGSMGVEAATIAATGSQVTGGVWLSPMYKSVDADGFNAQGASYGADIDLAGVAFGADTVDGNTRYGVVFNIGSGEAEGKGNGNGLKDDFDYYGIGLYSVRASNNFAVVADASYNVISHDVEGLGAKGSAETVALTAGLTGQYTMSSPMVDVTPHLGARFIRLDTDSYDLVAGGDVVAETDFDVQNVFSVPLGVTLSKAFEMGGWSLAPSADLSITFNTGDTDVESNTYFTGTKNYGFTTEVLDEVTYGIAVGLGAQYGAFGTQIGLNYTGSENTDSFGVNAQARYMF